MGDHLWPLHRWRKDGLWQRILSTLQEQADAKGQPTWELHHVDGSVISAHQHAAGAKKERQNSRANAHVSSQVIAQLGVVDKRWKPARVSE